MRLCNFFIEGVGRTPGLLSIEHLIYILLSFAIIIFVSYFTRKKTTEQLLSYIKVCSIVFLVLEILKIIWNLTLRIEVSYTDYVPLYFCSFFVFCSLLYSFIKNKNNIISKFSKYFLYYGGISGGIAFIFIPTTSLLVFPLLHVLSVHSLFYHSFMVIVSIWVLKISEIKLSDIKIYGSIVLIIEIIIVIINYIFNANFMMLNEPFGIPMFDILYDNCKILYPYIMAIGQMLITFYPAYYVGILLKKYIIK